MGSVEQVHLYTEERVASNGMRDLLKGRPISLHDESLTGHPQPLSHSYVRRYSLQK